MGKITLQQIIDAAWQKFIVEDAPPSADTEGYCCYLRQDGSRCAVGLVLPTDVAARATGCFGPVVRSFPDLFAARVIVMGNADLNEFQARIHDDLQRDGRWTCTREARADVYRTVAADYRLTLPNDGVLS